MGQYLLNPQGEADGLLLTDGTQVHFPPHMSADLARLVAPNNVVRVEGTRENNTFFRAFSISNVVTRSAVVESRPTQILLPLPPELRGVGLKPLDAQGKISTLLVAPRGETDGVVLDNGTIIRVAPDLAVRFGPELQTGQSIVASGYGTENALGRCLQLTALGLAGQALTPVYGNPIAGGPAGDPGAPRTP